MGNSETGTRLFIGLLGSNAIVTFYGDESYNRPMDRIINPLKKMGANLIFSEEKTSEHSYRSKKKRYHTN